MKCTREQPYVYEIPAEYFRYKQHDFNWERFLKNHPQIQEDEEGNLTFNRPSNLPNPRVQQNVNQLQQNVTGYKPYLK